MATRDTWDEEFEETEQVRAVPPPKEAFADQQFDPNQPVDDLDIQQNPYISRESEKQRQKKNQHKYDPYYDPSYSPWRSGTCKMYGLVALVLFSFIILGTLMRTLSSSSSPSPLEGETLAPSEAPIVIEDVDVDETTTTTENSTIPVITATSISSTTSTDAPNEGVEEPGSTLLGDNNGDHNSNSMAIIDGMKWAINRTDIEIIDSSQVVMDYTVTNFVKNDGYVTYRLYDGKGCSETSVDITNDNILWLEVLMPVDELHDRTNVIQDRYLALRIGMINTAQLIDSNIYHIEPSRPNVATVEFCVRLAVHSSDVSALTSHSTTATHINEMNHVETIVTIELDPTDDFRMYHVAGKP